MILSLTINELASYTSNQLNNFFPDKNKVNLNEYKSCVEEAVSRLEFCYSKVSLKHYNKDGNTLFNHLYSDHYVMYLWYLGNALWRNTQNKELCNKIYYLNKSLHSLDCMYDTNLPDIFLIFHGAGTMLGKATYDDYFVVLQGCTVGMNRGKYPVIGKGVSLTAHSSLIGNCTVGDNVTVSSYTNIIDKDIHNDTVVFRNENGINEFKKSKQSYASNFYIELSSKLS